MLSPAQIRAASVSERSVTTPWRAFWAIVLCMPLLGSDMTYTIQTIVGSDPLADGGPAVQARVTDARGVAVDAAGNVYYSDSADHRVRRITPAGLIATVAGSGKSGFDGDGGPADQALLNTPYGVAVDSGGNIYVADLQNSRVRRIGADGRISTFAGGGVTRVDAAGARATDARLAAPRNIGMDAAGNVYISDFTDHRVYKVTTDGRIAPLAGNGTQGNTGDGGPPLAAQLAFPCGVAVDRTGAVYIADSGNHAVRRVSGGLISTVPITFAAAYVNLPTGLAVDAAGNLYIASTGFDQAVKVTPAGAPSILARGAKDLAVDATGNVYIANGSLIQKVTPDGQSANIAGFAGQFRGDGSPASQAVLNMPGDVALDRLGNTFVLDTLNQRIRKVTPAGLIYTIAGDGVAGYRGDGDTAASARLSNPQALAADAAGSLYIADTDNHRIRKIGPSGMIGTIAGTGVAGDDQEGLPGAATRVNSPAGVAVDSAGVVYFADTLNHRVRRILPSGVVVNVAGNGRRGFSGDGGAAVSAQLDTPRGLALDSAGNLYIADSGNHRVRMVTLGGVISTVAGAGSGDFSGDGGPAIAAGLNTPAAVAVDATRSIFISDSGNHRVRRVRPDGIIYTVAGTGTPGLSGDGGPAEAAALNGPAGLAVDAASAVYVCDRGNHRIRKLTPSLAGSVFEPMPTLRAIHGARLVASSAAPGMFVSFQGDGIGPATPMSGRLTAAGLVDTSLDGVQVRFDGHPAPLLYAQSDLLNVQVPYGVAGQAFTAVEVVRQGVVKAQTSLAISDAVPGIFTMTNGVGPAAIMNEDGTVNSAANPAPRGSVVSLFATGEGQTVPGGIDGKLSDAPWPQPARPVSVQVGNIACDVVFVGTSIGSPGIMQVNFRVPNSGSGGVGLRLLVGSASSQDSVTIFVQ
jgi:uncharacterized protein (TIGR03437 family)